MTAWFLFLPCHYQSCSIIFGEDNDREKLLPSADSSPGSQSRSLVLEDGSSHDKSIARHLAVGVSGALYSNFIMRISRRKWIK